MIILNKVIVIGGGPAGMMAAIESAKNKNEVTILERENGWAKVEVDGETGYISETYVSNTRV